MRILLPLILLPFIAFGQTRHCEPLDALIDLNEETIDLSIDTYTFKSEYDEVQLRSTYETFIIAKGEGQSVLLMQTNLEVESDISNSIKGLKVLKGEFKEIKRAVKKRDVSKFEVLYDIKKDEKHLNSIGSLNYKLKWVTSSDYQSIIEDKIAEREAARKREIEDSLKEQEFLSKTKLYDYIGTYDVKVFSFDGRKMVSDTEAKLYLTESGYTLKWSFLSGGVLRGSLNRGRSMLSFSEGVFDAEISSGIGDFMILTIREGKTSGAISRMMGSTQLGTITFIVKDFKE